MNPLTGPRAGVRGPLAAVAAALVLTALNAAKPLHIDDVVHWYFASQVVAHPLAMYDFEIPWQQVPQPAQNPIAPPVLAYWWAAGIRLFGPSVVLWKLWLFPFSLALTLGMWSLFRRFARGLEVPLLWASALSPTVLPEVNLCVEVPEASLSVAAAALFVRACDRRSSWLALLAGLTCGLALQTKWSAFTIPGMFLAYALAYRRPRAWLLATGVALLVFVAWETFVAVRSGESHFVHQLRISNPAKEQKALLLPLITYVGGTAPLVALVGLAGLRARPRLVAAAASAFAAGFLVLAVGPGGLGGSVRNPLTGLPWKPRLDTPAFLAMGALVWSVAGAVTWRLCRPLSTLTPWRRADRRAGWFLAAWLALEVAGYFVLSPFAAARRIIHLVFVLTLLAGALASRTCRAPGRARLARWSSALGVALGLFYYTVDLAEAFAAERGVTEAGRWARAQDPAATAWFSGFWSSEFYGPRAGLKPVLLGRSELKPGDRLVVMDVKGLEGNRYTVDDRVAVLERALEMTDRLPFTTVPCYYIGRRPMEHLDGPRVVVRVFRVTAPFRPRQEITGQGHRVEPDAPGGQRP